MKAKLVRIYKRRRRRNTCALYEILKCNISLTFPNLLLVLSLIFFFFRADTFLSHSLLIFSIFLGLPRFLLFLSSEKKRRRPAGKYNEEWKGKGKRRIKKNMGARTKGLLLLLTPMWSSRCYSEMNGERAGKRRVREKEKKKIQGSTSYIEEEKRGENDGHKIWRKKKKNSSSSFYIKN